MKGSAFKNLSQVLLGTGMFIWMNKLKKPFSNNGICLRPKM
jgi:hypothetical protein